MSAHKRWRLNKRLSEKNRCTLSDEPVERQKGDDPSKNSDAFFHSENYVVGVNHGPQRKRRKGRRSIPRLQGDRQTEKGHDGVTSRERGCTCLDVLDKHLKKWLY